MNPRTPDPHACYDCGLPYGGDGWCDVVVPNDVWAGISPTGDEGGVLCFNDIARRVAALHLPPIRVKITSGPFITVHDEAKQVRAAVEAVCEKYDAWNASNEDVRAGIDLVVSALDVVVSRGGDVR